MTKMKVTRQFRNGKFALAVSLSELFLGRTNKGLHIGN